MGIVSSPFLYVAVSASCIYLLSSFPFPVTLDNFVRSCTIHFHEFATLQNCSVRVVASAEEGVVGGVLRSVFSSWSFSFFVSSFSINTFDSFPPLLSFSPLFTVGHMIYSFLLS